MSERESVLEDWPSEDEWAVELGTKDPRTTNKFMDSLGIPFVIVKRKKHFSRAAVKAALEARAKAAPAGQPAPRGRGRPRIREAA